MKDARTLDGIKITVGNFQVDDFYYEFNYELEVDYNLVAKGRYDNSHDWQNEKEDFLEGLKNSYALQIVVEEILPKYIGK